MSRRRRVLDDIDLAILWGMEDVAFRRDVLEVWAAEFPSAEVTTLDDVGHFCALEAPDELTAAILA